MERILRVRLMCRVSTEEQALHGDSMKSQEEALVQFAEDNNMKIVNIYRDGGFSARKTILKRPAMLELLEDVKAGKIDMILFTKLDRWFRNLEQYYAVQKILDKHGVVWKAILEDYNTATADGRFKVNIMLSVNEQEADRTSERIKFVFNSKIMRKEAIFPTRSAPLGYKVAEIDGVNRVVKDEETSEIVEYFFNVAATSTIRQAAIQTNQKFNINREYKLWYHMCHNELYKGTYKGVEDYCEPYITPAQFDEVKRVKTTRKAKNNRVYLFSGMITCPHCGLKMTSKFSYSGKEKKEYQYYRCHNTVNKTCSVKNVSEIYTEQYILEHITEELEKFILSHEVSQPKHKKKKSDVAKLKEQLRRVNVSYQAGNMDDAEYLADTKKIKALIEKAEKAEKVDTPVDVEALKKFLNSGFLGIYDSLEKEEKQKLWRSIIDELVYDGNSITGIKFKT